jgi:hypothetical protein
MPDANPTTSSGIVPTHALTLIEPWATLMIVSRLADRKRVETRGWWTDYRGPFAIHAGKKLDAKTCREEPFGAVLQRHFGRWDFLGSFKLGCILGVAELIHCARTEDLAPHQSASEIAFGDYYPGRFGFVTDYATPLQTPIPARGMLNFWPLPAEVRAEIARQMGVSS